MSMSRDRFGASPVLTMPQDAARCREMSRQTNRLNIKVNTPTRAFIIRGLLQSPEIVGYTDRFTTEFKATVASSGEVKPETDAGTNDSAVGAKAQELTRIAGQSLLTVGANGGGGNSSWVFWTGICSSHRIEYVGEGAAQTNDGECVEGAADAWPAPILFTPYLARWLCSSTLDKLDSVGGDGIWCWFEKSGVIEQGAYVYSAKNTCAVRCELERGPEVFQAGQWRSSHIECVGEGAAQTNDGECGERGGQTVEDLWPLAAAMLQKYSGQPEGQGLSSNSQA
ncbi:hypothetical protein B0H14DRAFT_2609277 [Mycena olivaceomarginata]|nr:hypothetical protein B0H14DRAFT_2609277 [Mycena olivaceomarginata]